MKQIIHFVPAPASWLLIRNNWLIRLVNACVLTVTFLSFALIVWRFNLLPPVVPLWYSRPWGADQLAAPVWLLLLPFGSLAIYGINTLISIYICSEYLIFVQILYLSSSLIEILSFITLFKILFIIT